MRRHMLFALLVAAFTIFIAPGYVLAQTPKPQEATLEDDNQVLRALLDEVRQLRMALQRTNAVSHRLQVMLERIRVQQSRVDSLSRTLENLRSRLSDAKTARPQMDEQIKYAEELFGNMTDVNRRAELEQQIKEMKAQLNRWAREEEQLRLGEAELSSESQLEVAKLSQLQNQLEEMVRQLELP